AQDFVVQGPADHGVPGLINLFGIESPGLTASLALAEQVRDIAITWPSAHDVGPPRSFCRPRGSARRLFSGHAAQRHRLAPGLYARSRHRLRTRSAPEARFLPARKAGGGGKTGDFFLR